MVSKRQGVGSRDGKDAKGNRIYLPPRVVNFREFTIPRQCDSYTHRQAGSDLHRRGPWGQGMPSRSAATLMKETELIPLALSPPPSPGLLGRWQDLREECIKLKKRVFDLERQNQMLSALFQQKLQLTTGSLPQVGTSNSPSLLLPQLLPLPALPSSPSFLPAPEEAGHSHSPPFWGLWPSGKGPSGLIDLSLRWGHGETP